MSIARQIAASKKAAKAEAEEQKQKAAFDNRYIAKTIARAKKNNSDAFPSDEIEDLTELAYKVVAKNFQLYPELNDIDDENIKKEIVKLTDQKLPITTVARNIDFEFYWQKKCLESEEMEDKNIKREQHGNSFKQAYIETHIQTLLENYRPSGNATEVTRELDAARYEVFCLIITQLQHFNISLLFQYLPNLSYLTLTYGAKHVGMEYERPLFGMKMSDATTFKDCLRTTTALTYLSLPGNLIDDDLIGILIKGLMLNKTITQLDLSHNKIGQSGARKIAKYLLQSQILTHLNLADNMINYEGSRYLCQALKVNKSLIDLNLKLNRIDDKAGQKMCIDLRMKFSCLENINLAANLLGNMFCESLSEYISYNTSIKKLDISSNQIDESNAPTLKGSLDANERIIKFDVKRNGFSAETEEEINEIVTKNFLKSQNIRYNRLGDNVGRVVGTEDEVVGQVSQIHLDLTQYFICIRHPLKLKCSLQQNQLLQQPNENERK